jgi:hypothetical protein
MVEGDRTPRKMVLEMPMVYTVFNPPYCKSVITAIIIIIVIIIII